MANSRNDTIDIVRGCAMLLVFLGHSMQFCTKYMYDEGYFGNWLFRTIYSFHMPLFMLLSGYLMVYSKKSLSQSIVSRLGSVVVPTIVFTILYLYKVPFKIEYLNPLQTWHFWFLWSNLLCVCVLMILKTSFKRNKDILLIVSAFLVYLIPDTCVIQAHKFMYQCFIIGYYVSKFGIYKTFVGKFWLRIGMMIAFIVLLMLWSNSDYIYIGGFSIIEDNIFSILLRNIYRLAIALLGTISFLFFVEYIKLLMPNNCCSYLKFIGINSIGFYGFQFLLFYPTRRILTFLGVDSIAFATIIAFVLLLMGASILVYVCKKVRLLNILFIGGR